jgi:ABC-type nitrate/sulfonate/bicarbonate transport system ATPase subunit
LSEVQIKNLTKSFNDLLVLENINFTLFKNEFLCICGPTGCGKTTLLNIIAGFIPATSGSVLMDQEAIDSRKHNLSFVFQEPSCLPWKNVLENVKLGLEIKKRTLKQKLSEEEINRTAKDAIGLVGLRKFENFFPNQISTGMKQMVVIARELAVNPTMLLMDEPFGSLDAQTKGFLQKKLLEIWSKLRKTVLFVTHNIEEAVYLADRVIILSKRPAKIIRTIRIDLRKPRNKLSPEFMKHREKITDLLKSESPAIF